MTLRRSITNELRNEAALSSTYAKGQDLYRAGLVEVQGVSREAGFADVKAQVHGSAGGGYTVSLVVDERGDTVSVSVAGQLVTRGTSDVCVSVTDAYETGPSPATRAAMPDPIDRSAYDEAFGTSTSLSASMETQPQTPMAPLQLHSAPTAPSLLDLFIDWVKETVGI